MSKFLRNFTIATNASRGSKMVKRLAQSCLSSVAATAIGLIAALMVGAVWWPPGAGITLIGIGLVIAGILARLFAVCWHVPASVIASSFGAMVACFFAGSTAEILPPGSFEWIWKGGLYGACFGLPVAMLLSPIGLIAPQRSVQTR
jgi:hypothetical protein